VSEILNLQTEQLESGAVLSRCWQQLVEPKF